MATAYAPDPNLMRQNFANQLAQQQKQALRGVQDIYASRGTTGSGEEGYALGQTGLNYGLGAGQAENQLQQYLGNLGQQQYQYDTGLAEQQRQFNVGQGNWQQQFGLNKGLQEAALTGQYGGQMTVPELQRLFANRMAEAGITGQYRGQQTLQGQQFGLNKALQEAGLLGTYNGQQTMQGKEFQQSLDTAQRQKDFMAKYGLTPELFQTIGAFDPTALRSIFQGSAPSGAWGWLR